MSVFTLKYLDAEIAFQQVVLASHQVETSASELFDANCDGNNWSRARETILKIVVGHTSLFGLYAGLHRFGSKRQSP